MAFIVRQATTSAAGLAFLLSVTQAIAVPKETNARLSPTALRSALLAAVISTVTAGMTTIPSTKYVSQQARILRTAENAAKAVFHLQMVKPPVAAGLALGPAIPDTLPAAKAALLHQAILTSMCNSSDQLPLES